ncbi:unnamed protein product [Dibothriocephalus latus]|uniref:Uncharacterized protein n=1 Tax=Dibothriocephalus latus TaxID=60516 RepID=A0A3P7PEV2_DIBLA|nr:unnamed protein product [Dibothriocephalus latus]
MTNPEAVLRCTLYRIIQACGEPGSTSEDVVNALFKYAVSLRDQWSVRISSVSPLNLDTLVEAFADRAVILARIFMYLMVSGTSTTVGTKETSEDFDAFQPTFVDDISAACANSGAAGRMHSPKVAKFLELCKQHCAAPPPETLFDWRSLEQTATPPRIHQGRRLRMLRIDDFVGSISIEAYVEFTKLRQSASFFATRSVLLAFLHWFFSASSSETASQRFSAGDLLAYLFTSGLYDLIDLAFCNRRLLGIQLSSPITSVELEQASLLIRRLSYL